MALPNSNQPSTGNSNLDVLITIARYALVAGSVWISTKSGYTQDQVLQYGGAALAIAVALYGAWRTKNWSKLFQEVMDQLNNGNTREAKVVAATVTKTEIAPTAPKG